MSVQQEASTFLGNLTTESVHEAAAGSEFDDDDDDDANSASSDTEQLTAADSKNSPQPAGVCSLLTECYCADAMAICDSTC